MKLRIAILGLSITSSWGNGHATVYRGLTRALAKRGHDVLFLERDKPWYAAHRDRSAHSGGQVCLYRSLDDLKERFAEAIRTADCVIVGSYVPEGAEVGEWVTRTATGMSAFYDIDTPITQTLVGAGKCEYLSARLISRYSIYLSFTGGPVLQEIERTYGSPLVKAFYCCVDPERYYPETGAQKQFDLGYIGTYSPDRQRTLERLLLATARMKPAGNFTVAGPMYPAAVRWPANVRKTEHVPPSEHRAFYNAQRFTLNITREDMLRWGYSPSVRLFEAAACGIPIITDQWPGLTTFFQPDKEILTAHSAKEVLDYLEGINTQEAQAIAERARQRILSEHTAAHRAVELEALILTLGNSSRGEHTPERDSSYGN
ncbi:MAG: glycosyltransferase [Verrucomicrobia bacterium]|nr:glycosyltransferase [Verrucomicrobiota bacterium]